MTPLLAQEPPVASVRRATMADNEALCRLSAQLGYPALQADFDQRLACILADSAHVVLVAVEHENVVGFGHVMHVPLLVAEESAQLCGLVVDAEIRSRGTGARLMAEVEAWAAARGCTCVFLKSNVLRTRAHGFYERLGYERKKTQYSFSKQIGPR